MFFDFTCFDSNFKVSNVCAWKTYLDGDELNQKKAKGFDRALDKALRDTSTPGILTPHSFDSGALLKKRYLVKRFNSTPSNLLA